jgi:hypothetical protein
LPDIHHIWNRKEFVLKKFAFITPIFIFGLFTFWGLAWFCHDWNISDIPLGIVYRSFQITRIGSILSEAVFCMLAIIGSIAFPIYIILYFTILRKKLYQAPAKPD